MSFLPSRSRNSTAKRTLRWESNNAGTRNDQKERLMTTRKKLLISGTVTLALLFTGCADGYLGGPYAGVYYGDFGPYYSGYEPLYGGDFIVGGVHYRNYAGGHHFYGRS